MKVTIDIECTAEEARTFLGLPDLQPMQKAVLGELQERMSANLSVMDPETLFKTWLPAGLQNLETLQRFFWAQVSGGSGLGTGGAGGSADGEGR